MRRVNTEDYLPIDVIGNGGELKKPDIGSGCIVPWNSCMKDLRP